MNNIDKQQIKHIGSVLLPDGEIIPPKHIIPVTVPTPEPPEVKVTPAQVIPTVNHILAPLEYKSASGFELRPFQRKAINQIEKGNAVLVTAPTGAGKTVIAYAGMMKALREGKTFIYTAPLKSINEQKLQEFKIEIIKQILSDKESGENQGIWGPKVFAGVNLDDKAQVQAAVEKFATETLGLITGDRQINPHAQVKIMTTEVYNLISQQAFYKGTTSSSEENIYLPGNSIVIFDEGHYLGDPHRGGIWEQSLMHTSPTAQIAILSATIGNSTELRNWLSETIYKETKTNKGNQIKMQLIDVPQKERPVELKYFSFNKQATRESQMLVRSFDNEQVFSIKDQQPQMPNSDDRKQNSLDHQLIGLAKILKQEDKLPAIFFRFSRAGCDQAVSELGCSPLNLVTSEEQQKIRLAIDKAKEEDPFLKLELETKEGGDSENALSLLNGVAAHHAEHLPGYKKLVEELFQEKLIKIVCATSTLAAGINMPARTVVITDLEKKIPNQPEREPFSKSEIKQMAGRAGRAGHDTEGNVIFFCDPGKEQSIQRKYIEAEAEAIKSALTPNYQTLFTMIDNSNSKGDTGFDKKIKSLLTAYRRKSLLQFQNKLESKSPGYINRIESFDKNYEAMITMLKELGYIDSQGKLTVKGNIAKEIKFNNPLFITEFIFKLNDLIKETGLEIRSGDFTALISLFGQDKSNCTEEKFNEFVEKQCSTPRIDSSAQRFIEMPLLLKAFIETYNELTAKHYRAGLANNLPQIDYNNFYAVRNWTRIGQKPGDLDPVQQFEKIMHRDSVGGTLRGLKRTLKSLEYLAKAKKNTKNFPALIKKSLQRCLETDRAIFKRGILAQEGS